MQVKHRQGVVTYMSPAETFVTNSGVGRCFDKEGLYKKGGGDPEARSTRRS